MRKSHQSRSYRCSLLLLWFAAVPMFADQTISPPTATPASISVNTPTTVTISAQISDPSLLPGSVNLQQLNATSQVFNVISSMYDDGTHGDVTAGDGVFTVRLIFDEPAPFPVVLRVSAAFAGRLTRVFSNPFNLTVTGATAPAITILSPANLTYFNATPITVAGSVNDQSAAITVNGITVPTSGGRFTVSVPLLEGPNTITAVARNSQGASSTASVQVTLDTTPPRITIDSPFDGYTTPDDSITVTGKTNDIVVGTVNNQQVQVSVNGIRAQVSNRSFQAANIPLSLGNNTIAATATDRAGNAASFSITVTRTQPTQPHIRVLSGNNQAGPVSAVLAQPLVVQVLDGTGAPLSSQTVVFAVAQNNGLLNGSPAPRSVLTDAQGQAQVMWSLGSRAGSWNLVQASVAGISGTAIFIATGLGGAPTKIVVDAGGQQTGTAGQPLPNPLVVVVTDNAHNRLANVAVTFQVTDGGGNFNGQESYTTNTDGDGRALAIPTLGPNDGIANNVVKATIPGNPGFPAAFILSGRAAGDPAATLIKGVVLDNSNNPVPGATVRVYLQNVPAQVSNGLPPTTTASSDANGQFVIQPAPVGFVKLLVDGSTIRKPGKWPNLEYELVTVPGQTNMLGMPVYLLPIDTQHQLCVSDSAGGSLTLPQVPGFALSVQPGSATFPGGSKTGCISVTPVHADKIPMVPGFGQQPRFIVTIQPAGTTFNPPAQITIPNSCGLKPGEITEMYGFDHDLGMFVSIGTGTTIADGTMIKSDRGVGVVKAGWFSGGPPADPGCAATCKECYTCNGSDCAPDPSQNGQVSASNKCKMCNNGNSSDIPLDPRTFEKSVTLSLPDAAAKKLNEQLKRLEETLGVTVTVNVLKIEAKTSTKECCAPTLGIGQESSGSVSGDFGGIMIKAKVWPPGPIPTFGPITLDVFGLVTITAKAELVGGVFLALDGSVSGEGGYRKKDCSLVDADRAGCFFAKLSTTITPSISASIGVTATFECIGCTAFKNISVEASFTAGKLSFPITISKIAYNDPDCNSGLFGGALQFGEGSFKISGQFSGTYTPDGSTKVTIAKTVEFLSCKIEFSGVNCQ